MFNFQVRYTVYLTLLVLGAYSQIAQALLIRESLVVFYGNEVSLGAFFGSWLLWIAIGSISVVLMREWTWTQRPLPVVRVLLLALPVLLALQILATRLARLFLNVSSTEFVPLGELFFAIFVITLPTSLSVGMAFPLACKILQESSVSLNPSGAVQTISALYLLEALGALLGGILFTFILIEWLDVWRSVGIVALFLAITAFLWSDHKSWKMVALTLAGLGFLLAATPLGTIVNQRLETLRFATLQPGLELLDTVETRYGQIAIARLENQISVVADGRITQSFPAQRQNQQEAAYYYAQANGARRILLFGGLAGGLAEELLRYPIERLEVIEEDQRAFEHIRPYLTQATLQSLQDPRLLIHFEDGRQLVNRLPNTQYDLVLILAADPASAHQNRYFTHEFYQRLRQVMSANGVLCTKVSSASNYLGREVKSYSGSVFRTLSATFPAVAIAPDDNHVYCASPLVGQVSEDPQVLEQRYRNTPLEEHRFPAQSFYSLLPADRIAFIRTQLQAEGGELNTDAKPVTYYLNMILWGKFSASELVNWLEALRRMGPWPYLVPVIVLAILMLLRASLESYPPPRLRRQAATLTLTVLGLLAMAVQLILLFSYQAQVGFMFGRIALLNSLFMTGLALGAGSLGTRLTRTQQPVMALVGLMLLVIAVLVGLPAILNSLSQWESVWLESTYLVLTTLAGLLTGLGFPLGVQLTHLETPDIVRSSGIIEAADHFGGALGGLLTGALLVPMLGIAETCYLLAILATIALIPLSYSHLARPAWPSFQVRGYRTFPFPLLSWGLIFIVITVFILAGLARDAAPGPTVHFDEETLAAVSQSHSFEFRQRPLPHYLGKFPSPPTPLPEGEGSTAGAADTVSLATATVANQVRGYAGPINLLVAVDNAGILRGVRYLESEETPAYIADIDSWLAKLNGMDISHTPLTLAKIDALSGATVSSRAALASINRAVQAGGQVAFSKTFAPVPQTSNQNWLTPAFFVTLGLLILFVPAYHLGQERIRLLYQATVLIIFGFWLNTLVTEIDLLNLSLGILPSLEANPLRYLMIGFVGLTALLFGQAYCGYVCPFGALQEFISRLGRFCYLRSYATRKLDTQLRYLKFVLLALLLVTFWITGNWLWVSFNPMQHIFSGHFHGWMVAITLFSLTGALFYYRFWCRYFCPVGAFLALSNKLAFLKRFAPQRHFEHCDLGVHDEYDVDCIECHRCVTGKDFGIRGNK